MICALTKRFDPDSNSDSDSDSDSKRFEADQLFRS